MRRRFPIIIPLIIGVCVLAFLFIGSNMMGRKPQLDRNQIGQNLQHPNPDAGPNGGNILGGNRNAGTGINTPNIKGIGGTPGPSNNVELNRMGQQIGFDGQRAGNIRNQLGTIDGVGQINTVVNDNTALVGYSPTGITQNANATKNAISNRVKQIDKTITNVIVSDSKDFSSRISRLADNIKNNRMTTDLNNEFNQLIKSVRPGGK